MKCLIVRHAIAEDREQFRKSGLPDSERPLTQIGKREMKKVVRGIRVIMPQLDVVASSPLKRASQTQKIILDRYRKSKRLTLEGLKPASSPRELLTWLKKQRKKSCVAVVGHSPHLEKCVSFLLTGSTSSQFDIRKGGVCLLELSEDVSAGQARMLCFMGPKQLQRLGKK